MAEENIAVATTANSELASHLPISFHNQGASANDSAVSSRAGSDTGELDNCSGISSSSVGRFSRKQRPDSVDEHPSYNCNSSKQATSMFSVQHGSSQSQHERRSSPAANHAFRHTPELSISAGCSDRKNTATKSFGFSRGVEQDPLAAADSMSAEQLQQVIATLEQKLHQKESTQKQSTLLLLLDFLGRARSEKQSAVDLLNSHISRLNSDIRKTEARLGAQELTRRTTMPQGSSGEGSSAGKVSDSTLLSTPSDSRESASIAARKQRLSSHFDSLQSRYFNFVHRGDEAKNGNCLDRLVNDISKATQFSQFRCRATLMHTARFPEAPGSDVFRTSNIVSSIEFDRESELLATAGVSKRIKIFEFSNILRNLADVHYPIKEIQASAKLSWAIWNPYIRSYLASSDYEGVVTLWDAHRGVALHEYEEHEKRAWSVDFSIPHPTVFASGSDDGKVKLWTTNSPDSVMTINNDANVCSVKFNPVQGEKLAFGSAHHHVHYYDLRNLRQPLEVFKSHRKTVSYVKFMSGSELVSACADSSIKLWNLDTMRLERTYQGHSNDRHFVGLSVNADYIACGSEENAVFGYYKGIPEPVVRYRFAGHDPLTGGETQDDDDTLFVSSVCWSPRRPSTLVCANSLGVIRVLDLVDGADVSDD